MSVKIALSTALSSVACTLTLGCNPPELQESDAADDEVEDREAAVEQSTFYIVTRRDYRKCAFPLCGGYYVKQVNREQTQCADGTSAEECYVAELDLEALRLDAGAADHFRGLLGDGHGLARGAIGVRAYGGHTAAVLLASEGWLGRSRQAARGKFLRLRSVSVQCNEEPCATVHAYRLNSRWNRPLAGVDLDQAGASQEARDEALAAMAETPEGILAAGAVEMGAGRPLKTMVASEFYTRVQPSEGGRFCGGIASFPCGEGQVCDPDPGMCDVSDVGGTCVLAPQFCPRIYQPVCGCNGRTYSNDCLRVMAGAAKFRDGECK